MKGGITDGKDFINDENLRFEIRRDSEGQADGHAARVALHRRIDELFDAGEVHGEFATIASLGMTVVRIFLLWEDFQPTPDSVDASPPYGECRTRG